MADTTPSPDPTAPPRATMNISSSTQTAVAGGLGSAGVVVFLWNWYVLPEGAPPPSMDIGTATAIALMMAPLIGVVEWVIKYVAGWLPMPPARNRRSQ